MFSYSKNHENRMERIKNESNFLNRTENDQTSDCHQQ